MNAELCRIARRIAVVLVATAMVAGCGGKSEEDLVASGKKMLADKDLPGALIQFKSALQKAPNLAEGRLLLGKALLESGDPVAAQVELRKAQELNVPDEQVVPLLARAMLLLGEGAKVLTQYGELRLKTPEAAAELATSVATAHLLAGDSDQARAAIARAQQSVPGFVPATVLSARILASEGDFDKALVLLEQALVKTPGDEPAALLKGEVLWHGKNDPSGAVESFRKVLAANPKAVSAHTSIISVLNQQKKTDESKAQFELLKQAAPNHPDTIFMEAQFAFAKQDYKATRELTDRLLKSMPENARVLELAGAAEFRLKQYVQAEAFLGRALKNAPGQRLSRHLLAQTYLRTSQPNKALEVLVPILESKTPDGTSLALAGEAWMLKGDVKKSEAAFSQAAKLAPNDARVQTAAALNQLARGNSGIALSQLEAIAAEDKGPRADVALVSARLKQNDLAGALKAIDGLERKTPERPLAYNLRGRVLLIKRDLAGATKAFETALSKDPNYFPAVASLAAMELTAGKPDAARKRFDDMIKANPKSHEPWLALAELATRTGAPPDEVLQNLRGAVKANAGEPAVHLTLVNNLLSTGDTKSALTAAREASAAMPSNFDIMAMLGRAQLAAANAEQAITTFKQLSALQPTNPAHQLSLAEAQMANKDISGAGVSLRKALEIRPDFLPAKRALAKLALVEKRPQDALGIAKAMQKESPQDPSGFALEGDVESSRKNFDAAAAAYKTALQLSKTTAAFVRMHVALRQAGKTAEADRSVAEWSKSHANDAPLRYYLGDMQLAQNDFAGAEAHYRAVLELQPRNGLAMNNIAWLLAKQGKPGAVAMAEKANEVLPGNIALLDTLATALAAENKLPRAIEVQKSAIARSPNEPGLKLGLAKLLIKSGDKAYARSELEDLAKLGDKFRGQAEVASLLKSL